MHIYAIGDLHLSGEPASKPMEVFGEHWTGHKEKIKNNWLSTVQPEDYVIIAGDISWAMNLADAAVDLNWIAQLPGHKLLMRGNHDYWWTSVSKMRKQYEGVLEFLQNDSTTVTIEDGRVVAICGTRGWILPSAEKFTEEDNKIYLREGIRMELGLQEAIKSAPDILIQALHYPPCFNQEEQTVFTENLEKYNVDYCVFGHIHGENNITCFEGQRNNTLYKLVSCDTQNFQLYKII